MYQKWIDISGRTTCELCDATYRVNVHSKNNSNAYDVMIFAIIYASVLAWYLLYGVWYHCDFRQKYGKCHILFNSGIFIKDGIASPQTIVTEKTQKSVHVHTLERKLKMRENHIAQLEDELEVLYLENQVLRAKLMNCEGIQTPSVDIPKVSPKKASPQFKSNAASPQFKLSL